MDDKTIKILEFETVLQQMAFYTVSEASRAQALYLRPAETFDEVQAQLEMTDEAYRIKYKYLLLPVSGFDDVSGSVDKAAVGGVLQPGELLRVARLIRAGRLAKAAVTGCGDDIVLLKNVVGCMYIDVALERDIGDCVAGENELRDDASPELKAVRRKISSANARLKEKLLSYARSPKTAKYLQDSPVTVRDGRFVLPVKSECRSEIPGIVHDVSGSGATAFIEPFPVVELNNEIRSLVAQEREEVERILRRLSEMVGNSADVLRLVQNQCIMLDIICAKCDYSVHIRAIRPQLNRERYVRLAEARHPLIDANKVVPVSMAVGREFSVLVITGPNTGGKTVCLKTLGLMCLMAYSGIFVPCQEETSLCVFDGIFCDIGDEQSIEQSLSTFSAHIVNLVDITERITPDSLLLLDELGAGTDPAEGAALAVGVLQYLELMQSRAVVTTHYSEIKEYSLVSPHLMNACMQFDEQTLRPTYRLIMGLPGVSNALKISAGLGLNDFILQAAYRQLSEEKIRFERVLAQAESVKSLADKERGQAQALKAAAQKERADAEALKTKLNEKYESIRQNARIETVKLIADAEEQADELLERIKQALDKADSAAYLQAKQLRKKLENMRYASETALKPHYTPLDPQKIKAGERVTVMSLNAEGVVQNAPNRKGEVTVLVGVMPMTVSAGDLAAPLSAGTEKPAKPLHVSAPAHRAETEVKVLGLTVSEAIEAIEPYLMSCSGGFLRIIHGKGTGALGKGIQRYLKTDSRVRSYRYGQYGEGDTGVTIAELK